MKITKNLNSSLVKPLALTFWATSSLFVAHSAQAVTFNFSFGNEDGAVNGIVQGIIDLPEGDGTFAANSVTITSLPNALGMTAPIGNLVDNSLENVFFVVGGEINGSGSSFFGLINSNTALALNTSIIGGATFLDAFNAGDDGNSGVLDLNSSTLTFSPTNPIPEPLTILGSMAAVGFVARLERKRNQGKNNNKA